MLRMFVAEFGISVWVSCAWFVFTC